jgi:uncharacterized protein (TIGR02246 family)
MRTRLLSSRFVLLALMAVPLAGVASDSNVDAIRKLQTAQAAAWNKHDADAYAALFTSDGDVVNVLGWWWRGRDQIQRKLSDGFSFVFRDSRLTITDVDVRILSPTVAVAHVRWTMDGAKTPPGAPQPPREGIQLQVLTKQGHDWHIASFQNTNSFPEQPFPTKSPTSN